ncbi:RNA dependent RNA polymerase-domain-containing protein [Aspergillus pseudotamarii]|uniref:RNA-dependent RNA polymerase n=1 Tax=Aspergillus pseudotamarii TaxID=132259 RepID=A0A5N6SQJ7_ASPPS|nr:RNA dependent RNA polymerase-domain-containing protein [Aspergillus pseudotamarii]KAE8136966.1 RNA dependent RNA polymerase-domain-containing protein [Aspergillus pseudotamarii]
MSHNRRSNRSRDFGRHGQGTSRQPQNSSRLQQQPAQLLLAPWTFWDTVAVNLFNLPREINTRILWQAFSSEGYVSSIDLFEDSHGNKDSRGKIRFRPPPQTDFWRKGLYTIKLPNGRASVINIALDWNRDEPQIASPVRSGISYPVEVKMPILSMDIGVLFNETTMLPMRSVGSSDNERALLVLNLKQKALLVYFQLPIFTPGIKPTPVSSVLQEYRLKIPFVQLSQIFQMRDAVTGDISHFIVLDSPPLYHRRISNIDVTHSEESNTWRESETWYRQTYIVRNALELSSLPIGLKKAKAVIDIGRWNTFKITYPRDADIKGKLTLLCNILKDYNVTFQDTDRFTQWDANVEMNPSIWKWIDLSDSQSSMKTCSLEDLFDHNFVHLPFQVRYQLEVCISNGYLSEFTMTREFAVRLSELGETRAVKLLEHVSAKKQVYYDPMKIFDLKFIKGVTQAKIPPYCCYMHSARITPSTIYYNTPTVDISNRVIRRFIEHADRFLRVRFTDEKLLGRINSTTDRTMDEIFTRIKRALTNGIVIGDRRYEFLAFGNSQFREHGAYFFAPLPNLTAANIRAWMGHFNSIRNVAKHAARLGQCFSTTRAIAGCPVDVVKIEDVERNGYNFSDGVGRISRFLAQMSMSELKIKTPTGEPPSAFQFRLGGCKGMLAVSSEAQRQEVHIRKSQVKFAAIHNGLEIVRWSQFSMATLNRQLIIVLSTLGIPDQVFHAKLHTMLRGLDEALESDPQAIYWLKKYVDPNQMTLTISQMVLDGFRRSKEPFLTSIMTLWRAWHLKYLKEKARIVVDQGACLLGCIDETGLLQGYFHDKVPGNAASVEEKTAALPEIFVQVSRPEAGKKPEVIQGVCTLARNPSLHPGDIRVVRAVNVPQLHHLRDVVVLPQTGDRDVSSMCSGGDLDGDDYIVIWDQDLLPKDWFHEPMKYTSNKAQDLDRDVTVNDITSFFVTYMKNDFLPRIAHAHLALADFLEDGVNEEKCIRLAQLHSDAVDYNKTGIPAMLTRNLEPRKWPHFMEKIHKPKDRIYHSNKILGQLYDAVERIDFAPSLEMPFDKRLLNCEIEVSGDLLTFAKNLKEQYDDAMRRVMAQHEIKTEFEVWSTFVLSHANTSKDYKFHEEIGAISTTLRETFQKQCYEKVGGRNFDQLTPLALAMYRVTNMEMTDALNKYRAENSTTDHKLFHKPTPKINQLPLISFPWIFPHILGKIALGHFEIPGCLPVVDNDPFGLFTDDLDPTSPLPSHCSISATAPMPQSFSGDVESLEKLLDFGLSTSGPHELASSTGAAPSDIPIEASFSLLDFTDIPKYSQSPSCNRSTGGVGVLLGINTTTPATPVDTIQRSGSPSGGGSTGGGCVVQSAGVTSSTPDGVSSEKWVEIVEEEDDLKPTALDKLNELLGF